MDFFEQLRDLVGQDELERALLSLREFVAHRDPPLRDGVKGLEGSFEALRKKVTRLAISQVQELSRRTELSGLLLQLIADAQSRLGNQAPIARLGLAVAPPPPPVVVAGSRRHEKIIGADRMMSLAWWRLGLTRSRAVCRIVTPLGHGTGFLIPGGKLVTCQHVLASAGLAEQSAAEFNYEEDEAGQLLTVHRFALDPARLFCASEGADVAVVALGSCSNGTSEAAHWGHLQLSHRVPVVGDFVSIVQHPNGNVKRIAASENEVVQVLSDHLQYTTDTLPGSSGSPVFDDRWDVVAIHHAGGDLSRGYADGSTHFVNEGVLTRRAVAALGLAF